MYCILFALLIVDLTPYDCILYVDRVLLVETSYSFHKRIFYFKCDPILSGHSKNYSVMVAKFSDKVQTQFRWSMNYFDSLGSFLENSKRFVNGTFHSQQYRPRTFNQQRGLGVIEPKTTAKLRYDSVFIIHKHLDYKTFRIFKLRIVAEYKMRHSVAQLSFIPHQTRIACCNLNLNFYRALSKSLLRKMNSNLDRILTQNIIAVVFGYI